MVGDVVPMQPTNHNGHPYRCRRDQHERDAGDGRPELAAHAAPSGHHGHMERRRRLDAVFEGRSKPAEALFELEVRAGHASTSLATESAPSWPRSRCNARWTRTRAAISLTPSTSPISANIRPSK